MIGAQSGFEATFQEIVFYAGPIIQLAYWLVMIVAALWAVTLFKRWVAFQTGAGPETTQAETLDANSADASNEAAASRSGEQTVSVDEFVE